MPHVGFCFELCVIRVCYMEQGLCNCRAYVHPPVSSSCHMLLLWVCCCGPNDQEILIDWRVAGQQQQHSSKCGECHIVSCHRKLNANLLTQKAAVASLSNLGKILGCAPYKSSVNFQKLQLKRWFWNVQ